MFGGPPGAAALAASVPRPGCDWTEHDGPGGRKYYYNNVTKVSSWTKPEEMMTPEVGRWWLLHTA